MSRNDFMDKIKKPFGNAKPAADKAASGGIDKAQPVKSGGGKTRNQNVTRVASKASGARGGGGSGSKG